MLRIVVQVKSITTYDSLYHSLVPGGLYLARANVQHTEQGQGTQTAGLAQFSETLIHGAERWRRQSSLLGPRDRRRKVNPEVAGSLKEATSKIFLMFSTHS